jgi:hypothetical protein
MIALSQNLTYVPSFLATSFVILTMIALATSHFLIELIELASLIATTTVSPYVAFLAEDDFNILNI